MFEQNCLHLLKKSNWIWWRCPSPVIHLFLLQHVLSITDDRMKDLLSAKHLCLKQLQHNHTLPSHTLHTKAFLEHPLAYLTSWALCCSNSPWKFPDISMDRFSSVCSRNSIQVWHFSRNVCCCSRRAWSLLKRQFTTSDDDLDKV